MTKRLVLLALVIALGPLLSAEKISFSAKSMSGKSGDKESPTTLSGNAQVTTESMEIRADSIRLSGEDFRFINAEGSVSGKNTETKTDFMCQRLSYDRQTKVALLEGDVEFVDTENEVTAKAGIIEYDQDREVAVMQIDVNLTQEDNVCTSAHAVYKKTEQLLEMNGNPQIVQNDDTFRAQTIVLNMDTQEITLMGNVQGSVTTEEGEEGADTAAEEPAEGTEGEFPPPDTAEEGAGAESPDGALNLDVREAPPEGEGEPDGETAPEEVPEPSK